VVPRNFAARKERARARTFLDASDKSAPPRPLRSAGVLDPVRSAPCVPFVFEQKEGTMSVSFYLGNLKDSATTIDFVEDLDINLSNGKARTVLNALGLPDTVPSLRGRFFGPLQLLVTLQCP
jgi:hypothetical protein